MSQITRDQMHAEHQLWEGEISHWREEIARWKKEHQDRLAELEQAIAAHASTLEEHANALGQHEENTVQHEHFLAELLKSGRPDGGDAEDSWLQTHTEERNRHAGQRDAHERIKRHHHTAMAKLAVLMAALRAPE
jgi:uncharacterized coiled-coil protein SlyX